MPPRAAAPPPHRGPRRRGPPVQQDAGDHEVQATHDDTSQPVPVREIRQDRQREDCALVPVVQRLQHLVETCATAPASGTVA